MQMKDGCDVRYSCASTAKFRRVSVGCTFRVLSRNKSACVCGIPLEACVGRACAVPRGLTKLTCCKKTIFPLDRNLEECFCSRDGVSGTSSSLVCRRLLLHFFL